jgi:predicted nucleic acid-binding Zn ribbon protein
VASPFCVGYTPAPGHGINWAEEVFVICGPCGNRYPVVAADVLVADAEVSCDRCGSRLRCPTSATLVWCSGCGGLVEAVRVGR